MQLRHPRPAADVDCFPGDPGRHIRGQKQHRLSDVPGFPLASERRHLHVLPAQPHAIALGAERLVESDQTIRFGSVRYSTPDGHQGSKVWCRVAGEELVIVGATRVTGAPGFDGARTC